MKIAKKILSVLITIAMILSSIAVASVTSFAATKYQASMSLGAMKMEYRWTTNTKCTITELGEEEETGTIEVEPGDFYAIRFHLNTNYFASVTQALVYAPIEMLDPADTAIATGKTPSAANLKKLLFRANDANEWISYGFINSANAASYSTSYYNTHTSANERKWANAVKDSEGNNFFNYVPGDDGALGYSTIVSEGDESAKYGATYIYFLPDGDVNCTIKVDGEECLCEFPVHIPEDATPGQEFKVFIPAGSVMNDSNKSGTAYCAMANDDTNPDIVYEDEDYDELTVHHDALNYTVYSADQTIDFSGATLTFKVPGGPTVLDWSALEDAVAAAPADNSDGYYTSASWTDSGIDAARADAIAEVIGHACKTQEEINALTKALNDAVDALKVKADYSALNTAIQTASVILENSSDYIQDDKWTAFENALGVAAEVDKDLEETPDNQMIISDAAAALETAISELNKKLADYTAYNNAVNTANEALANPTWYVDSSLEALATVMAEYGNLPTNIPISEQSTVDEATGIILDAYNALIEAPANYEPLTMALAEAAKLNELDYTAATWKDLADAVAAGNIVAATLGIKAKNQAIIDDAADAIAQAIVALAPAYASTTELANTVAVAAALNLDWYEDGMAKGCFLAALEAAQAILRDTPAEGYPGSYQATIDEAKVDLEDTMGSLSMKFADYSEVHEAIAAADALDKTLYTEASLEVLANAILAVKENLTIDKQGEVDAMAAAINDAIRNLQYKDADYTALDAEIETSNAITNSSDYTEASWKTFDDARTAAKAVARNLKITDQETIDNAKNALESARKALVGVGDADYSKLNAAIAEADKKVQTNYTAATWVPFNNARNAAKAIEPGLNASHQGEIDAAEFALTEAMGALVPKKANTEALETAVEAAKAKVENAYKYESVTTLTILLSFIKSDFDYTIFEQETVDELTSELNTAMDELVWAKYVPTPEQDSMYAQMTDDIDKGLSDYYTTATWNAAKAKYDSIDLDWTYEDEATAGRAWDEFQIAFGNLAEAKAANYDEVDAQIAIADGLNSAHYTMQSWSNLEMAIAAVERGLNENHQAEVDKMAADIAQAIADLVPYADYGLLDSLILDAETIMDGEDYINDYYTDTTKAAFDTAYDEAVALSRFITEDEQNIVDEAANKLYNAMQALNLKGADYSALDDALAAAKTYNQDDYTAASWAVLANAVTAAQNVNRKLTIKDQATVDALTDGVTNAIGGLEEKPVVEGTDVTDVKTTPTPYGEKATYELTVTGRAIKVQFVDKDGNTWTYDRYRVLNEGGEKAILSYNETGEVIHSDARDVHHEVWTVTLNLPEGEYKVVAKYSGSGWQTDDAKNYKLTVVNKTDDNAYISSDYATSGAAGRITVKVTTEANVQKVQLAMNGTTNTSTTFVTNPDGTRTFTLTAFTVKGENNISVSIKSNNKWYNDVDTLVYTAE